MILLTKSRELKLGNLQYFLPDINSLYTNISTDLGLKAVRKAFKTYHDPLRPDKEILELLEISLTCNDFIFDSQFYLQIQGTAMGKKFAPAYANLYMAEWKNSFTKCTYKPSIYFRFLDNIFGAWQHDLKEFENFMNIVDTHHPFFYKPNSLFRQ